MATMLRLKRSFTAGGDMRNTPFERRFSHRETCTERRGCVGSTPSRTLCLRLRGS